MDVPVHYGLAEHGVLWDSTPEGIAVFAATFASAPRVTAHTIKDSGHNMDHHYAGRAFHSEQLDWAAGLSRP